jgi:hypothetical protein
MDLTDTITPTSDQLDAVDLLSGPRTFLIEKVSRGNAEQPVNIHLADFPRVWRPGKSMRRVLVSCWGADASAYVGRRVELYCDPDVRFGGQAVGGTRIAAVSHIDKAKQIPLLVGRGKSAIFVVKPLGNEPPPPQGISKDGLDAIIAGLDGLGITDRPGKLAAVRDVVGRDLGSARDLTAAEGADVLAWIAAQTAPAAEPDTLLVEGPPEPPSDWPTVAEVPQ